MEHPPDLEHLTALPFLAADVPPVPARLRTELEDFVVEEIPAYLPEGRGDHLFVWLEKRDLTTPEAVKRLAAALGVDARQAGWAGLKDRRGVTRQWVSFEGATEAGAAGVAVEGVRVLAATPHRHKLRTGHLRANRFVLRLRGVPPARDSDVRAVLDRLSARGMPNYFGAQRFGRGGETLRRAEAWLVGGGRAPRDPFDRKLLASALQSEAFNRTVALRVERGVFDRPLSGDVLRKELTGGLFVCRDPHVDAPRVAAWEVSPTGPMWGPKARAAEDEAAALEAEAASSVGGAEQLVAALRRAAPGTRRAVRARPEVGALERQGDALVLDVTLPAGSFATILLREITKDA